MDYRLSITKGKYGTKYYVYLTERKDNILSVKNYVDKISIKCDRNTMTFQGNELMCQELP